MKPLYEQRGGVCSRGWLFLGEQGGPCDKACEFCYYAHQKNLVFFDFPTVIGHANLFRHYYGLNACDITGGEPTIYRTPSGDIVDLVAHCARIGLQPTIISHGQNIRDDFKLGRPGPLYQAIEEAGLRDWLISLHGGSAASHDKILGSEGSFARLTAGLDLVSRPVRFNSTICIDNYRDLPVSVLLDRPPTVWNAINFNPFHAWSDKTGPKEIDFQVQYREAAPFLARAVETLEAAGWEVNVRYWPLCIAQEFGFAENVCGYHQVSFDPWEWRLGVTNRASIENIKKAGGWYKAEREMAAQMMASRKNKACSACALQGICDKAPEQYQAKYGVDELRPISGPLETNPLVFQERRGLTETAA